MQMPRLTSMGQMIFCLNSMLAWLMKSPLIIEQIEKLSHGYLKMDCEGDKCYGVLAVSLLVSFSAVSEG